MKRVGDMTSERTIVSKDIPSSDNEKTAVSSKVSWFRRGDVQGWVGGLLFLGILLGMIFVVGNARGWDALSGYTHNTSLTSAERFLPEPYREEEGVRGRYGAGATGRWYYWKLPTADITVGSRLFCWLAYVIHQVLIWAVIYHAQLVKAREPYGKGRYTQQMSNFNWVALCLNVFFHLVHFVNTHATYDGLAQDVSIATSQSSVIMLLVLVVLLEYKERGLAFGWPTMAHKQTCSVKIRMSYGPVNLVRRYHGYAFAWAACYTFWYHPMENTWGHALGFVHTYIILLQGALMYTDFHLNKYWRLTQEVWVIIHGGVIASQTGGPALKGTGLWPMFVFGFLLCFVITQVFSLPVWTYIPWWCRIFPLLIYFGVTIWCYSWIPDSNGQYFVRMQEIIRIPGIYYLFLFVGWGLLLGFLALERRCSARGSEPVRAPEVTPAKETLWLSAAILIYALHVGRAVAIEYADWKMDLTVLMIIFVGIYMIGVCVSFMFLKQVVPLRITDTGEVEKEDMEELDNEAEVINYKHGVNGNAVHSEGVANDAFTSNL